MLLDATLDALSRPCYHDGCAQAGQAVAGGCAPSEESPNSVEHGAG